MGGGSQAVPDRCLRLSHGDLPLGTLSAACGEEPRMDRVRFITHQGQQILLIDLTKCSSGEVMQIAAEAQRIVTAQPSKSVLALSDLTGAQFSRDAVTRMKEVAVFDRPCEAGSACGRRKSAQSLLRSTQGLLPPGIPAFQDAGGSDGLVSDGRSVRSSICPHLSVTSLIDKPRSRAQTLVNSEQSKCC